MQRLPRLLRLRSAVLYLALLSSLPLLQGCFTLAAVGAGTGVMTAIDRRTVGAQAEDEAIEWKASGRISDRFKDFVHVNITSYNRRVLISGEVPTEEGKALVEQEVRQVENVQTVFNELAIAANTSMSSRTNDAYLTSKVKTRFIDSAQISARHIKVVTEAGTVFLMGIVSAKEAMAAIDVARTTNGVVKVINLMEVVTDVQLQRQEQQARGNTNTGSR